MSPFIALEFVTALACGMMGGLFFAFSSFVMTALSRLPADQGIAAMQAINKFVMTPVFAVAFFGTPLLCLIIAGRALLRWNEPAMAWALAGTLCYIAGCFIVTVAFNVPLNNRLATADPHALASAELWTLYLRDWSLWNHVRTITGVAAAGFLTAAIWLQARAG